MAHQHIWQEQCEAVDAIKERHGLRSALDYIIGEKLLHYAGLAVRYPEYAQELPRFVATVRSLFSHTELSDYLATLDTAAKPLPAGVLPEMLDDDDTPADIDARTHRAKVIAELLLSPQLGTA